MIQKYGSAFLNSEGGVIIGGVSDTGMLWHFCLCTLTLNFEANLICCFTGERAVGRLGIKVKINICS